VNLILLTIAVLAQAPAEKPPATEVERLHAEYRADAEKYAFFADAERQQPLKLVEKPVMKWANDDDWSGDVFLWTRDGLPAVIGCPLSGPVGQADFNMFHEFHLLDSRPIAAAELQTRRTWQPTEGLKREPMLDQKPAADTPTGRLVQMRQIAKGFTAHMQADGPWELRLLPQPLFRYGDASGEVIDGAIFTWVWSKGTDPELVMLVELRPSRRGTTWYYAPVRFSNRALWLKYENLEVWRVKPHEEPGGTATTQIYTTAYARSFPRAAPTDEPKPQ
jgi:hypothetical protein